MWCSLVLTATIGSVFPSGLKRSKLVLCVWGVPGFLKLFYKDSVSQCLESGFISLIILSKFFLHSDQKINMHWSFLVFVTPFQCGEMKTRRSFHIDELFQPNAENQTWLREELIIQIAHLTQAPSERPQGNRYMVEERVGFFLSNDHEELGKEPQRCILNSYCRFVLFTISQI